MNMNHLSLLYSCSVIYHSKLEWLHRGAASMQTCRTVLTGPNLNSTQNGDPIDWYRGYAGRDKLDELRGVPERFCESLWKSRDMKVCIWHKMFCILPELIWTDPNLVCTKFVNGVSWYWNAVILSVIWWLFNLPKHSVALTFWLAQGLPSSSRLA